MDMFIGGANKALFYMISAEFIVSLRYRIKNYAIIL